MAERLKAYSSLFIPQEETSGGDVFELTDRGSELILSAPHATPSWVRQKLKAADLFSGEIVSVLGEDCNISTIVRRRFVPYKTLINDLVAEKGLTEKSFLDFHGMHNQRPFDLAVGTGQFCATAYKKEARIISELADKYQIRVVFNHPDYRGGVGLTGRLQREYDSDRVLQLEWRRDFRDFYNCPEVVCGQTIPFMKELISFLRTGFHAG